MDYRVEIVDPGDVEGPINVVPETWDDEKPHELNADWSQQPCWCEPRIEGKYVHHRSVFDAIGAVDLPGEPPNRNTA